jgi:outer membrane immunogenic protein
MKNLVAATVAAAGIVLGTGTITRAADLPIYTKAPPVPVYSWTGFYAGVDIGYAWKDPTVSFSPNDAIAAQALSGIGSISFNDSGVFGGADVGYNWQFNRYWLAGLETDFNASSIEGSGSAANVFSLQPPRADFIPAAAGHMAVDQEILWFGTVRARAGWLPTDNLLLYGTGGFAYAKISEAAIFGVVAPGLPFTYYGHSDRIATGWTAGAGAEYRVPGTNASLKLEYLFVDLGAGDSFNAVAQVPPPSSTTSSFLVKYSATEFNTVKFGVNWHW